jgi:hypothetical protein
MKMVCCAHACMDMPCQFDANLLGINALRVYVAINVPGGTPYFFYSV